MSELGMRKVKKIPHPLIDEYAKRYADLQYEINGRVEKMSEEEVRRLRLSIESLTSTNCWFIEKDLQPMIEFAIGMRKSQKHADAAHSQTKEE